MLMVCHDDTWLVIPLGWSGSPVFHVGPMAYFNEILQNACLPADSLAQASMLVVCHNDTL